MSLLPLISKVMDQTIRDQIIKFPSMYYTNMNQVLENFTQHTLDTQHTLHDKIKMFQLWSH